MLALLALLTMHNLLDSRSGRAIRALKGGGLMAESFGVDTARMKIIIFVHAALLASLSGWLYAHLLRFVNPTPFSINAGIEYLFMAVVGGAASVWGAVVGAGILTVLKQWLQDLLPKLLGQSGNFEMIVFGILLVLLLQRAREGIMPLAVRYFPAPRKRLPAAGTGIAAASTARRGRSLAGVKKWLRKAFGGLVAVNDLSFSMLSGEILGLIGPNGAGKSTVFNLVTGVLPLTAGEVHFRGERIDILSARAIVPRGLARTFQQVRLLPTMSVLENVAIGAHLRGSKGVISAALRLERAEEAMLLAEAARQLERVGWAAACMSRRAAWRWASSASWKSRGRYAPIRCCCCLTSLRPGCATRKSARLPSLLRKLKARA